MRKVIRLFPTPNNEEKAALLAAFSQPCQNPKSNLLMSFICAGGPTRERDGLPAAITGTLHEAPEVKGQKAAHRVVGSLGSGVDEGSPARRVPLKAEIVYGAGQIEGKMDGAVPETNAAEGVGERMLVASWFNAGAAFAVTDSLAEAKEAGPEGSLVKFAKASGQR